MAVDSLPLADLPLGESAEIVRVDARGEIKRRLLEMGVVRGTRVLVERVAPLGDPIEIRVKGYHLSLRREEAAMIEVKKLDN